MRAETFAEGTGEITVIIEPIVEIPVSIAEDNETASADPRVVRRGLRCTPVLAPEKVLESYLDTAPGKADIEVE